jgi:hypothetical protein
MKYNIPNTHIHPWGGEIKTDEIQYTKHTYTPVGWGDQDR